MKSYVVEIRRYGEVCFAARIEARSAKQAGRTAVTEYKLIYSPLLIEDRLGMKYNPGWLVFTSLALGSAFRVFVKEG